MASINTIVKRKQYLWLGIVVVGTASAIGGALYLSDVDMSGNGETVAEQEPVPDMTGVVDTTFDDKVRQHATTEMQVTAAQMQKQYEEIRRELDVLNKQRGDDQRRIEKLGQDNAALAEQVKALGANPVTAAGEPVPQMPASPPGPEGEPQPGNTPVSFPPQGSVAVPPPTAFYPRNGVTPPPQVTYQSVPLPTRSEKLRREVELAEALLKQREQDSDRYSGREDDPQVPRQLRQSRHRRPLPAHLPREIHRLEPEESCCPECGGELDYLGEVSAEQLELVSSALKVIRTERVKKACTKCDCIVEAPAPSRPIERGIAGPGLLARVLTGKYCEHLPLYRQSEIFARQGVELSRALLSNWVDACCQLMTPVNDALYRYVMNTRKVHTDDTPVLPGC
mgnify:FL=1